MRLHIFSKYTYTLESIIQAGQKGMAVTSVPIRVNAPLRPSRLVRSTMLRIYITYRPLRFFANLGIVLVGAGTLIGLRFLYLFFATGGTGHVQSLILAALLVIIGFFLGVVGTLVDLIAVNRQLLEKLNWRVREIEGRLTDDQRGR